jgi:two-component system OmpR family response regulator
MKILIVENNPLIASAIERAGEELQMSVDHASDGWEAIEKLENEDYAAIVIDSDLPRQSGFGVLTYLREEVGPELDHVVVMTSSDRDVLRSRLAERVNVIRTTDEVEELTKAVRMACGVTV